MSSINSISSSSASSAAAAYQQYLARLQAQKDAAKTSEANAPKQPPAAAASDVDHDGDSH